jgi:RNA polymerase sigma-70 factor (ECF subfamily)
VVNVDKDIKLQNALHKGNRSLDFSDVFREYQHPIYNYLLRMTQNKAVAEELTQETFIRVHRSLHTFRGEARLSTWIYRIATNVNLDHFKSSGNRLVAQAVSLDEIEFEGEWVADRISTSPEKLADQSEMSECVQSFIHRLSPSYRAVLVLHDLQGLKNREIADVLDIPLSTVKIRLHRARNKLRESLNKGCDFNQDERNIFVCEPKAEIKEV